MQDEEYGQEANRIEESRANHFETYIVHGGHNLLRALSHSLHQWHSEESNETRKEGVDPDGDNEACFELVQCGVTLMECFSQEIKQRQNQCFLHNLQPQIDPGQLACNVDAPLCREIAKVVDARSSIYGRQGGCDQKRQVERPIDPA
ncbi:hypothetical protein KLNKPBOH_00133 [Aeromonas veronii]